jgi:hypothetical protein
MLVIVVRLACRRRVAELERRGDHNAPLVFARHTASQAAPRLGRGSAWDARLSAGRPIPYFDYENRKGKRKAVRMSAFDPLRTFDLNRLHAGSPSRREMPF